MYYQTQAIIKQKFRTQWDFAQRVNMHESVVSRVLSGRQKLSEASLEKWAEVLGCDRNEVLPEHNE